MKPVMIALFIVLFLVVARDPDADDDGDADADPSATSERDDVAGESDDAGDDDDADVPPDTGADDVVVLTFDASPHPVQTPAILEVLAERDITAEFCVTDARAAKYPALVKRIFREGHAPCAESSGASEVRLSGDEAATVADLPHVIDDLAAAGHDLRVRPTATPAKPQPG